MKRRKIKDLWEAVNGFYEGAEQKTNYYVKLEKYFSPAGEKYVASIFCPLLEKNKGYVMFVGRTESATVNNALAKFLLLVEEYKREGGHE